MSRHKDEQDFGNGLQQLSMCVQHDFFFSLVSARSNPDRPSPEQLRAQFLAANREVRRQLDVELDIAGHSRALGCSAQRQEALRVRVALRGNDDAV